MLKTSLTFEPTHPAKNEAKLQAVHLFFDWAAEVAQVAGKRAFVTMQHSLKEDEFAAMVEVGTKTFSSHHRTPIAVFKDISNQLFKYYEKLNAESDEAEQKKERSPGKEDGQRRRRAGSARKRSTRVLQR